MYLFDSHVIRCVIMIVCCRTVPESKCDSALSLCDIVYRTPVKNYTKIIFDLF